MENREIKPRPGDIIVRYHLNPSLSDIADNYREIGRYLVLDKIGLTGRNAPPFATMKWSYDCLLLSFDQEYYSSENKVGSTRQVGEWMFRHPTDRWEILVESGLSWEGE